jgi:signal transduction histidine kinase
MKTALPLGKRTIALVGVGLTLTVVFVASLGYRATEQWRRSAVMAAERRADEVAALLLTALTMDMQSAQQTVLLPFREDELMLATPNDLANSVASAFARFPYPESFFVWKAASQEGGEESSVLFSRPDRLPPWEEADSADSTFPVVISQDSPMASHLGLMARNQVLPLSQFALFQTTIADTPYQVVARLFYDGGVNREVLTIIAFTVNLDWIRRGYFPELLGQIERVSGATGTTAISMAVLDDTGAIVTENHAPRNLQPVRDKPFSLAFFDSSASSVEQMQPLTIPQWITRVNTSGDPLLEAADSNANLTLALILLATSISIAGILLAMKSLQSNLELAVIKSDFVARASHELKTPLASISLVADTLSKKRFSSYETVGEYGVMLSKETRRLTRLVENLLTFSRITSSPKAYAMTLVDIGESVAEALQTFRPHLDEQSFTVTCEVPKERTMVYCDRDAITQAFESIIDNAIKYSGEFKTIAIRVWQQADSVIVSFSDSGRGILAEDVPHVFDKFFRGANAGMAGTGLGLSIARKIVEDHGGRISLKSTPRNGTMIQILLPSAENAS